MNTPTNLDYTCIDLLHLQDAATHSHRAGMGCSQTMNEGFLCNKYSNILLSTLVLGKEKYMILCNYVKAI